MERHVPSPPDPAALARTATVVYALQAVGIFFGITLIAGVVINYIRREDVRGTWLESHFRWQIRTFWFTLLWAAVGCLTFVLVIGYFVLLATTVWLVYRIAKGWIYLSEKRPMYPPR